MSARLRVGIGLAVVLGAVAAAPVAVRAADRVSEVRADEPVVGGGADEPLCPLDWSDGFTVPGIGGDNSAEVRALCVFDDGTGPALYAGGRFSQACDVAAAGIARWDGQRWSAVGAGAGGDVYALCVFDDGSGAALYAGGSGLGVKKWNGTTWTAVGKCPLYYVYALCVYDDGSGAALYAGGSPSAVASYPVVQKWNGSSWVPVGGAFFTWDQPQPAAYALTVYDDGTGPALYAGGAFSKAGDAAAYNIAKWDGTAWWAFGDGGVDDDVYTLCVYDDGTGAGLYVGGRFEYTGQGEIPYLARWDGQSWSALGDGISAWEVDALCVYDDGKGPALYVTGDSLWVDPVLNAIGRWDGQNWSALGSGLEGLALFSAAASALAVFDAPGSESGPALYAGGDFTSAGGVAAPRITRWEAGRFWPLGHGDGLAGRALALTVFDDGTGPALYAAGAFASAGPVVAKGVARWDGEQWSAVGTGTTSGFRCLCVFDDGHGPALYMGGASLLSEASGLLWYRAVKWNGREWSGVGEAHDPNVTTTYALTVFDDGSGPALYAGDEVGVWRWDGATWLLVGSNLYHVFAMAVYDDGSGPGLYAGGEMTYGIVKWNGVRWRAVGGGVSSTTGSASVAALQVFDDGTGPALYVGGGFEKAGSLAVPALAKWNGTNWSRVDPAPNSAVHGAWAFGVFDDGAGEALYLFTGYPTGNSEPNHIVKWTGSAWWPLGVGCQGAQCMAAFEDSAGRALYIGGAYRTNGKPSAGFARWGCVGGKSLGDTNCDGAVNAWDIDGFVYALLEPATYAELYPGCIMATADCNRDGFVNGQDIDGFVSCLFNYGCP